jgi:hypothetical protein
MTVQWLDVSSTTPRIAYTATAAQTTFTVPFVFFADSNLKVYQNGTLLTLSTHYTVTGVESATGGSITLVTGATVGDEIMIARDVPIEQTTHIPPTGQLDIAAINIQFSKLIAIDQQLHNEFQRSLHFPADDSTISGEFLSPGDRANKLLGFDSDGGIVFVTGPNFVDSTFTGAADVDSRATAQVTTFPISTNIIRTGGYAVPGDGGDALYKKVVSQPSHDGKFQSADGAWWEIVFSAAGVDIRCFGGLGGGSDVDDTDAIRSAVTACEGKRLIVAADIYRTSETILIPPGGIYIVSPHRTGGFGMVEGAALFNGIFGIFDDVRGYATFDGLTFVGNGADTNTGSSVGAIYIAPSILSTIDITDIEIKNCTFADINQNNWIACMHAAQGPLVEGYVGPPNNTNVRRLKIHHNTFLSVPSNATPGFPNRFIYIQTNLAIAAAPTLGSVFDLDCHDNVAYGLGVCSFITGIGGVVRATDHNNQTFAMGNSCEGDLRGYTHTFYQSSQICNVPQEISIVGCVAEINHNFGIYCAGVRGLTISACVITGTFRPNSPESLPFGTAIAVNGCSDWTINGCTLTDNYGGIDALIASVPDGRVLAGTIANNTIRSSVNSLALAGANPFGISFQGDSTVTKNQQLLIASNTVKVTGDVAVALLNGAGGKMGPLEVIGNQFTSEYVGYLETASALNPVYTGLGRKFSNNKWRGGLTNAPFITTGGSSPLTISNDEVDFSDVLAGASSGFQVDGNTAVDIDGLVLRGKTNGGAALSMIGTQGRCKDVSFPGTTSTRVAATSSGLTVPTWVGRPFDTWQNFGDSFFTETGSTPGSKYTLPDWAWSFSTTWLKRISLTGN